MRRLLIAIALAACTPAANAPTLAPATPSPDAASATLTPTPTPLSSVAPTATVAPTRSAVPTVVPIAAPSPNDIHNEGQKIFASFTTPLAWFFGEASFSPATQVQNYRLNGASLAGSALRCTKMVTTAGNNGCAALVIVPSIRLVNDATYELKLVDQLLGTFTVQGLVEATPHVLSAKATQYYLTVTFDRPMLHAGDCGASTWSMSTPGTIEFVRGTGTFPAPAGAYTSTHAGYRDFLTAFVSEANVAADCKSVTFGSGWGSVTGVVDVVVAGVEDVDGNLVEPGQFQLTIADETAPKLMFANVELQTAEKKVVRVAFSEAMDAATVRDASNYRLNGSPLPPTTILDCELASCTWVRLTFAPSAFAYGSSNTLSVSGVRDLAGKTIDPATSTSAAFPVY